MLAVLRFGSTIENTSTCVLVVTYASHRFTTNINAHAWKSVLISTIQNPKIGDFIAFTYDYKCWWLIEHVDIPSSSLLVSRSEGNENTPNILWRPEPSCSWPSPMASLCANYVAETNTFCHMSPCIYEALARRQAKELCIILQIQAAVKFSPQCQLVVHWSARDVCRYPMPAVQKAWKICSTTTMSILLERIGRNRAPFVRYIIHVPGPATLCSSSTARYTLQRSYAAGADREVLRIQNNPYAWCFNRSRNRNLHNRDENQDKHHNETHKGASSDPSGRPSNSAHCDLEHALFQASPAVPRLWNRRPAIAKSALTDKPNAVVIWVEKDSWIRRACIHAGRDTDIELRQRESALPLAVSPSDGLGVIRRRLLWVRRRTMSVSAWLGSLSWSEKLDRICNFSSRGRVSSGWRVLR